MRPETFDLEDMSVDSGKVKFHEVNKTAYKIECKDPYGFWYISAVKGGRMPEALSGTYTTYSLAQQAIDIYANAKKE